MKKLLLITAISFLSVTVAKAGSPSAEISNDILENFTSSFPEIKHAKWYKLKDYYHVYFVEANRSTRIDYDLKGKVIRSRVSYDEKSLPAFLRARITEVYPNKTIYGVTEITDRNGHLFEIVLEDAASWFKIRSNDEGDFTEVSKLTKA